MHEYRKSGENCIRTSSVDYLSFDLPRVFLGRVSFVVRIVLRCGSAKRLSHFFLNNEVPGRKRVLWPKLLCQCAVFGWHVGSFTSIQLIISCSAQARLKN